MCVRQERETRTAGSLEQRVRWGERMIHGRPAAAAAAAASFARKECVPQPHTLETQRHTYPASWHTLRARVAARSCGIAAHNRDSLPAYRD